MTQARKIPRDFYAPGTLSIARDLIGMHLVHNDAGALRVGRIVETEAYMGPQDLAAHSAKGRTARTEVMFGPPGHAYVYFIYGFWYCLNIVTAAEGVPHAVLLRALEPVTGIAQMAANRGLDKDAPERMIASGPSRLCMALGLTRPLHNGVDVTSATSSLQVRDDGFPEPEVVITPRIGIKHAVDWPLRFALRGHICVSGPKWLAGLSTIRIGRSSVE